MSKQPCHPNAAAMARSAGPPIRRKKSHLALEAASDACATAPVPPTGSQPLSLHDIASPVIDENDLGAAPPSPSTLTDIILSLHASLYGAKRSVDEIRGMVWRYYDNSAGTCAPLSRQCLTALSCWPKGGSALPTNLCWPSPYQAWKSARSCAMLSAVTLSLTAHAPV